VPGSPAPNWSKRVGQVNVQVLDNGCLSGEMKQVVAADAWNIDFNMKIRSEEPSGLVCSAAQLNSALGKSGLGECFQLQKECGGT
jgi:hypothetical protein